MSRETTILFILISILAMGLLASCDSTSFTPIAEAATTESDTIYEQAADNYLPTVVAESATALEAVSYPIVDTGQTSCYDNSGVITCPAEGGAFFGQDTQYIGNTPSYADNGDGTITDNVSGLVWQQNTDTDRDMGCSGYCLFA